LGKKGAALGFFGWWWGTCHARSDVALREVPAGGESSEQARGPALGWLRRRRALPAAAAAAIGAHVFGREKKVEVWNQTAAASVVFLCQKKAFHMGFEV